MKRCIFPSAENMTEICEWITMKLVKRMNPNVTTLPNKCYKCGEQLFTQLVATIDLVNDARVFSNEIFPKQHWNKWQPLLPQLIISTTKNKLRLVVADCGRCRMIWVKIVGANKQSTFKEYLSQSFHLAFRRSCGVNCRKSDRICLKNALLIAHTWTMCRVECISIRINFGQNYLPKWPTHVFKTFTDQKCKTKWKRHWKPSGACVCVRD